MTKKQSFAKLSEDLDKLEQEPVVKSVEEPAAKEPKAEEPKVKIEEVAPPVVEPEVVVPVTEEPKVEEPAAEEVEKSAKDKDDKDANKKGKDKKDSDDDEEDKDEDPKKDSDKKDDKKDKEPVKKSAEVEEVSEADFLGAFEAVVKSFGGLKSELAELKKSMSDILAHLHKPAEPVVEEPVAKSAEPVAEEPKVEEPAEEVVAKSVEPEPEGKAVEYVSKSNGIPEPVQSEEEEPAAEPEFNAKDHVKQVTDYFMKNAGSLTEGEKFALRGAVNRVKRGEGTTSDVDLFEQIAKL